MTRLEHLRALLDALARAYDDYVLNGTATAGDVAEVLTRLCWALREAAPALIDVAEAVERGLFRAEFPSVVCDGDCQGCAHPEWCDDMQALRRALAPLTEEVDHE